MAKIKLIFQNPSVNGRDYRAKGLHILVPGQGEIEKDVPAEMVQKVKADFKRTAPYIQISEAEAKSPEPKKEPEAPKVEEKVEDPPADPEPEKLDETAKAETKADTTENQKPKSKSKKGNKKKAKKNEPSNAQNAGISDFASTFVKEVKE